MTRPATKQVNVRLDSAALAALRSALAVPADADNNAAIYRAVEMLPGLLRESLREVRGAFTEEEANAIVDSRDLHELDSPATSRAWGIDAEVLAARIRALPAAQRAAIELWAERGRRGPLDDEQWVEDHLAEIVGGKK